MIEFNNSYFLKQRDELILIYDKLKNIFRANINKYEELRTSNFAKYEALISHTNDWIIPEKFDLEEIINLYIESQKVYNVFLKLPDFIKTTVFGVSMSTEYDMNKNFMSFDLVNDLLSYFEFLLPTLEDYKQVFIKSGELSTDASKKLSKILVEKKLYNFIVYFGLESVSSELRKQIEIFPFRKKNYEILYRIQRYGFVPVSNFEKIIPENHASIIKLDYINPILYNFICFKKVYKKLEGVSIDYIKNVVQPYQLKCSYTPPGLLNKNSNLIYETFDNVYYRKLYGKIKNYERGPSAIALGYNTLFNEELKKKTGSSFATSDELDFSRTKNKLKFETIISRLEKLVTTFSELDTVEIKKKILEELKIYLAMNLEFPNINSYLKREINIGMELEMVRFKIKLDKSSYDAFFNFLRSEKSNIIHKVEQKIKIFSKMNNHFTRKITL